MRVLLIELCALIAFVQIGGEFIKNEFESTPGDVLPPQNGTDTVNCCVVREIIRRIEALLQKQLERGELKINSALKPEETVPRVRNVRQSDDTFSFNKCVLKSDMEQHKHVETEHIFAIKQELEHLKELIRLLRDQQQILNMLNDVESKAKSEDEEDQRKLIKLFRMLQTNLPQEAKSTSAPLPPSTQGAENMNQIIIEIRKLHQQIENANRIAEDKLKIEVNKQQNHLQQLQNDIENLQKGQALFVHLNSNKSQADANNQSDIVGAILPKAPLSKFLEKLKPKSVERKSESVHEIKLPKLTHTPRVRAGTDDFFESLQRILESDTPPETKETPLELDLGQNSGIENRLLELEKQMQLSSKIKKLEKKIQQLHETNAESKNLDDDDDDLKAQMKKLQRQLKNINKSKVESKELDEDNILDELKSLQNAINDLRPKEDTSQPKIGNADIQVMLNRLIGVPAVRPVVPVVPAHSQLTPAQIQILRRVMAMKAASSPGHHAAHGQSGLGGGPYGGGLAYDGHYGGQGGYNGYEAGYGHGGGYQVPNYGYNYGYAYTPATTGHKYGPYGSQYFPGLYSQPNGGYNYAPYPGFGGYSTPEVGGSGYYPLAYGAGGEHGFGSTYPTTPVAYKPSPPAYSAATDISKAGASYATAPKGYAQGEGNFFRGYENADQSDASQSYAYPQENPYTGDSYSQQRIGELQDQIYQLQSVISNLNRPEYIQKPEDQQVIYDLDSKIGNLKGIVSNLAHPSAYGYAGESGQADAYDASPKSSKGRTKRDLPRAHDQSKTAMNDFLRQIDDILSVVNYFTNDWHQKHQDDNSIERVREVSEQVRKTREVEQENPMARILNKLYSLAEFVDSLGEKVSQLNQNCTASGSCESKAARRKREAKDSGEDDDVIGALGLVLQGMVADESKDEDNSMKKDVHPQALQSKLNDLKKQLEHKLHSAQSARMQTHLNHRSSTYDTPVSYQPNYYNPPLPTYYTVYDDDDDKDKYKTKDKDKFVKLEVKKTSKFDKIFSKILDKIIIKIIKALPIILQKLIGIEIDKEIEIDSSGGYYDDGYGGVQKKQSFGFFGLIPVIIFKVLSNITYFVKKLKKVPFIRTFLVPALVTVGTAGLVIFLVWWLTGDEHKDSYGYGGYYKENYAYNNHDGYDSSYRSANSNSFRPSYSETSRFRNSEPKPVVPSRNTVAYTQRVQPPLPYNYHKPYNRNFPVSTPYRLNNFRHL